MRAQKEPSDHLEQRLAKFPSMTLSDAQKMYVCFSELRERSLSFNPINGAGFTRYSELVNYPKYLAKVTCQFQHMQFWYRGCISNKLVSLHVSADWRGVGLDDLQWSLPIQMLLWFLCNWKHTINAFLYKKNPTIFFSSALFLNKACLPENHSFFMQSWYISHLPGYVAQVTFTMDNLFLF